MDVPASRLCAKLPCVFTRPLASPSHVPARSRSFASFVCGNAARGPALRPGQKCCLLQQGAIAIMADHKAGEINVGANANPPRLQPHPTSCH